ncbi:MAG TPA: hypothetical protein VL485_30615 [Ktedonobacteraceae bacterium]|jgi:hypothetical protein|nr:hypothetical protein [Ktedonobacteraceae bacterium]
MLLQHELKKNIEKLQDSLSKVRTGIKENMQSGLQRSLQAGLNAVQGTGTPQEKETHMSNDDPQKNVAHLPDTVQGTAQKSTEASGEVTDATKKAVDQKGGNEEGKNEGGTITAKELTKKVTSGLDTTRDTLNKVATGVNAAQDMLTKISPLLDQNPGIKTIQDTLTKTLKGIDTAQSMLNKAYPLVGLLAHSGTIRDAVSKLLAIIHTVQEILNKIVEGVRSLQELLGKVSPLIGMQKGTHALHGVFDVVASIIEALQELLSKIIAGIDTAQHALRHKVVPLVGGPHPEKPKEPEEQKKLPVGTIQGDGAFSAHTLELLRDANIINMDMPLKNLLEQIEDLQLDPSTEWGVIGDAGHMMLVWSGK